MTTATFDIEVAQIGESTQRIGVNMIGEEASLSIYTETANGKHQEFSAAPMTRQQCRLLGQNLLNIAEGMADERA